MALNVAITVEEVSNQIRLAKETKFLRRSVWILLLAKVARGLVQICLLLKRDSGQAWATDSVIMDAFSNRPCNSIVLSSAHAPLSHVKHQQIATVLESFSANVDNKFNEPSPYISNPPFCESLNLVHHQP